MTKFTIPNEIKSISQRLSGAGFRAYLVGGCVRDMIIGKEVKDWDFTTNAKPHEIEKIFAKTFYNNKYGTVTIVDEYAEIDELKNVEITPFRLESRYSDARHPDMVEFTDNILDDLKRRDFTMNSMAYDIEKDKLEDPFKGQHSIKDKLITTVGKSEDRFKEDALRLLRAPRLATELSFDISKETEKAIFDHSSLIKNISVERIRDEFSKTLMTDSPKRGMEILEKLGLLEHIVPELRTGIGIEQRGEHIYDVFEHNLRALQHSADKKYLFHVRLSALLHDVAKPHTRERDEEKKLWTFHGHDVVGAKMSKKILERLHFSRETIETVTKLVRYHLFFSDVDKITLSAVRRLVSNVGNDLIWDLMKLRYCDRIGTGRPKETPYRLRKFESMIEEVMRDPVTVAMLKIDGLEIIELTKIRPGRKIGYILHALLEEVLDDPSKNTKQYLSEKVCELAKMKEEDLEKLGIRGKEKKDGIEEKEIGEIRKKHWVR